MGKSVKDLKIYDNSLFARKWNSLIDVVESMNLHAVSPLYLSQTLTGTVLQWKRQRGGGTSGAAPAAGPCPFDMTLVSDGAGAYNLTFFPGTINQYIPSNLLSTFPCDGSSTYYAKIHCTSDGIGVTGSTIVVDTTPPAIIVPTSNAAPTSFDFLIGLVIATTADKIMECGNLFVNPVQAYLEDKADPVIGITPFTRWWTWDFTFI